MYRIFVVEDDPVIAEMIKQHLGKWGHEILCADDFRAVDAQARAFSPHLVILDISLPFFNGYYWCEKLRAESKAPVLFISSRTESADQIMAMNLGADDYLVKPFSAELLVAKVNALLRRAYRYADAPPALEARGVLLGSDGTLTCGERHIDLTKNELRILRLLMENKNRIVSREALMKALWDSDSFIDDNTLTVNINRMRRKLDDAGLPDDFIVTRKGEGYLIRD